VKTNQTLGILCGRRCQLREVERAAMVILFDRISYALEGSRRMIEFTRDLNVQFWMPSYGVIINRDPAIRRNKLSIFR
jgi:hypothetical protein